jgi:hypothetical protein
MTTPRFKFLSAGITIVAVIFLLLIFITPAAALGVLGAKYSGSIAPGGTDTQVMTIDIGANDSPTDVVVGVAGFGQTPGGAYIPLNAADDLSPYSARTFITLDNTTIHVEPGTTQGVTATISLPQNVGAGGRYAIIYIRSIPGKGAAMSTAVDVPVFITVAGTTPTITGTITQVTTGAVTLGQPITVTTTFTNTGNYHYYAASNEVALTDANGNLVGNVSTTPMATAIIPGNTVQFVAQPPVNNLKVGNYTVDSKVILNGQVLDEKTTTLTIQTNYIPPATESNITVTPGSPATLATPDGRYSVSLPQGAVTDNVVITLKPYALSQLSAAPAGAKLGTTSFQISGLQGLLSKDATVTVTYSSDDLAAAGGDASQLKLAYYDAAQSTWVILPTQVNTQDMKLTAATNHLGIWVVMVSSSTSAGAPAAETTKASLPAVLSIVALAATAIILGGTVRQRK